MRWVHKKNGNGTIHEAVDAKSNGRADEFLAGTGKTYRIQNLNVLASWIGAYVKKGAPFFVVGDYDCDGVMAASEMKILLEKLGARKVVVRVPKRMSEGYGLSEKIVEEFDEPGVIVTVDNGIRANAAIAAGSANVPVGAFGFVQRKSDTPRTSRGPTHFTSLIAASVL